MDSRSDEELIARFAQQRDNRAIEVLYERYAQKLLIFLTYKVKSHERAEDLVQNTFIKCIRSAHTYDPNKASFSTWIQSIAFNTFLDSRQSEDEHVLLEEDFGLPIIHPDADMKIMLLELKNLPTQMPEMQEWLTKREMEVWEMVWDDSEISNAEMGRRLGVTPQRAGEIKANISTKIGASESVIEWHHGRIGYDILKLLFQKWRKSHEIKSTSTPLSQGRSAFRRR